MWTACPIKEKKKRTTTTSPYHTYTHTKVTLNIHRTRSQSTHVPYKTTTLGRAGKRKKMLIKLPDLRSSSTLLLLFLFYTSVAQAQFQFFEQMFSGGHQQQQQQHHHQDQHDVPSDSSWYQKTWEGGEFFRLSLPATPYIYPPDHIAMALAINGSLLTTDDMFFCQQPNAADIYVREPLLAFTSHTTARVRIPASKTRWSWAKAAPSVFLRAAMHPERL
jgi:hypothetical protein